ncbi:hypothetical protein KPL78_19795 [Roseomonas sp. HJA6]|uniref:histidine kinase n=1 Tax=Roseomonas alba TaxID=2846776 RepID=A0ABS7AEE5_9PROT|nr:hypothetical protein [Neoroseomonas alba]MBW6400112.1 hypothetical protein [Neoroseomonas alba]
MSRDLLVSFARPVRHEANNLLAALSGTAELMLRSPSSTERDIARAERLRDASARLQALLHAYLALGAPPPADTAPASVIEMMRPLIGLALGPGRKVEVAVAPDLPRLATTPAELQSLVLGLVRSAAEGAACADGIRVALDAAPGGARLSARLEPGGSGPEPAFLSAA